MPEFSLPHDHGAHGHTEDLYRELKNVEHFGAVCDIFKQLSDPTRVRISGCSATGRSASSTSRRCSICPAPPFRTICVHLRRAG